MGCFDSVCSVSNIPVHHGDEIVMIYLGTVTEAGRYGSMRWQPIAPALYGEYNDYGDIEEVDLESVGWKYINGLMKGPFKDVTKPTPRESDPLAVFQDESRIGVQVLPDSWAPSKAEFKEEDRSYRKETVWRLSKGNGTQAVFIFVHRAVFDHLVNTRMQTKVGWDNPRTVQSHYDDIPDFCRAVIRRVALEEEFKALPKEDRDAWLDEKGFGSEFWFFRMETMVLMDDADRFGRDHLLNRLLLSHDECICNRMFFHAQMFARDLIEGLARKNAEQEMIRVLEELARLDAFSMGLEEHNINYAPFTGYAAGQYQERENMKSMLALFDVYKDIQQSKLTELESWDEEDEDDD